MTQENNNAEQLLKKLTDALTAVKENRHAPPTGHQWQYVRDAHQAAVDFLAKEARHAG